MKYFLLTVFFLCVSAAYAVDPIIEIEGKDNTYFFNSRDIKKMHHYVDDRDSSLYMKVSYDITDSNNDTITNPKSCLFYNPDIPTFDFRIPSNPDAEQVWLKETYTLAELDIAGNGMVEDIDNLSVNVKGRGNSTWWMDKKPMRLKFDKKISLCGMKKAKSYVLLANYIDPSALHNAAAFWLANRLQIPFSNSFVPCNVFMNGNFLGIFLLTEKIGVTGASVDIDEEKGVLFELSSEYDEPYKFRSELTDLPVMVKDPDFAELFCDNPDGMTPDERLCIWQADFNKMESVIVNGSNDSECNRLIGDVLDLESFVNLLMVNNIACNHELIHPKSFYMWKDSTGDGSKYHAGPAWDFDAAFNKRYIREGKGVLTVSPEGKVSPHDFFRHIANDSEFLNLYKDKFDYVYENVIPELYDFLDSYTETIEQSHLLDIKRWNKEADYEFAARIPVEDLIAEKDELKNWIAKRMETLKKRLFSTNLIW